MGLFDRFRKTPDEPDGRIHMVVSVGQFVAGETYDLPVNLADRYISCGYGTGTHSRPFTPAEVAEHIGTAQVVQL